MKTCLKRIALHFGIIIGLLVPHAAVILAASDDETSGTQKTAAKQVGGLLFDVDEGVKIEQGPGGSVYMKSNRDFMQEKFQDIDRRLADLEKRIGSLESKTNSAALAADGTTEKGPASANRRVLTA